MINSISPSDIRISFPPERISGDSLEFDTSHDPLGKTGVRNVNLFNRQPQGDDTTDAVNDLQVFAQEVAQLISGSYSTAIQIDSVYFGFIPFIHSPRFHQIEWYYDVYSKAVKTKVESHKITNPSGKVSLVHLCKDDEVVNPCDLPPFENFETTQAIGSIFPPVNTTLEYEMSLPPELIGSSGTLSFARRVTSAGDIAAAANAPATESSFSTISLDHQNTPPLFAVDLTGSTFQSTRP